MNKALFNKMLDSLTEAQYDRMLLPMDNGSPDWNTWEMLTLMKEVNTYRYLSDKTLISWNDIKRVEQMACGHSDYTRKFVLYCVELATQ